MFGFRKKVFGKVKRNIRKIILVTAMSAMLFASNSAQAAINIENHLPSPVRAEITQSLERHPIKQNQSLDISIHVKKAENELKMVEVHLSDADKHPVGTGDSFNFYNLTNFQTNTWMALDALEKAAFEYRDAANILGDNEAFKSQFEAINQAYYEIYKDYFNVKYEEAIYHAKLASGYGTPIKGISHGGLAITAVTDLDKTLNIHLRTMTHNIPYTSQLQQLLETSYGMTQELFREITNHRDGSPHAHSGPKANAPAPWWKHTPHTDHLEVHRIP
tara:strand:+ start:837 stop:1661 length:825 start_codon:yes stop_codon:yes gene_type:complete